MALSAGRGSEKVYVVEHLDPELGPWSALEYQYIAQEVHRAGARCCLSSVPRTVDVPEQLKGLPGLEVTDQSVEMLFGSRKSRVCLLDPGATVELRPSDQGMFDVFLFGGILGASCSLRSLRSVT